MFFRKVHPLKSVIDLVLAQKAKSCEEIKVHLKEGTIYVSTSQ